MTKDLERFAQRDDEPEKKGPPKPRPPKPPKPGMCEPALRQFQKRRDLESRPTMHS